jgi:hypothetical protein
MAGESDEPDEAAERLEMALERIAMAAERRINPPAPVAIQAVETQGVESAAPGIASPTTVEIAARLDGLIERLRGALAVRPG